jgi:hypothetical protein
MVYPEDREGNRRRIMRKELGQVFNDEVERYRRALIFAAKTCEWETFKVRAGKLFDYVESVEISEIERKFFRISMTILLVVVLITLVILNADTVLSPQMSKYRENLTLIGLSIGCYEFYFVLDFKLFMKAKMSCYRKRRERFIRNLEKDFREMTEQPGS